MAPLNEVTDAREVTELLGAWEVKRDVTEEIEGLLPCVGVTGAETATTLDPNRRRVEENSREGSLLDEEYFTVLLDYSWTCLVLKK